MTGILNALISGEIQANKIFLNKNLKANSNPKSFTMYYAVCA